MSCDVAFVGIAAPAARSRITTYRSEAELPAGDQELDGLLREVLRSYFRSGGGEAHVLCIASRSGALFPTTDDYLDATTGLALLDTIPDLGILVLPALACHGVLRAATALCERRRVQLLIDIPEGLDTARDIAAWLDAAPALVRSPFVSAYTPWLRIGDVESPRGERTIPPTGAVAGALVRTDATSDGTLRGTLGPVVIHDDESARALAALGVNAIRHLPGLGTVPYGVRTLAQADGMDGVRPAGFSRPSTAPR